jgi:hypothetical protein
MACTALGGHVEVNRVHCIHTSNRLEVKVIILIQQAWFLVEVDRTIFRGDVLIEVSFCHVVRKLSFHSHCGTCEAQWKILLFAKSAFRWHLISYGKFLRMAFLCVCVTRMYMYVDMYVYNVCTWVCMQTLL